MSDAAFLQLEKLTLAYGDSIAVRELDLTIGRGELVALLGPSGCGKTTTMRAVAGLLKPRSGRVRLEGVDLTRVPANRRPVGLVFQSYALFPHLTVFENVAFGLRLKGLRGDALADCVDKQLESVGLSPFAGRKPAELSGGQQQRVALARSMVVEPKVLLLDEPLSNLDARLRLEMRAELQRVQRQTGVTMIFVTHDQSEALALADRVIVMRGGAVEQTAPPEQLYNHPASAFVANFVGFENVFKVADGKLQTAGAAIALEAPVDAAGLAWRPAMVVLGQGPYAGVVRGVSFAGDRRDYLLDTPLGPIKAETAAASPTYLLGQSLPFDLPLGDAARLSRYD